MITKSVLEKCPSDMLSMTHKAVQSEVRRLQAYGDRIRKELKRRKRDNKGKVNGAG